VNKDTLRQIVNAVAVVLTIAVNGLASTTLLNGKTTGQVSDGIPALFTPAGYVFAIWGVIYLGLIAFAVYQALPSQRENPRLRSIGYIFALSCLANVAWLVFWQYEILPVTIVLMLVLLGSLIAIYLRLNVNRTQVPAGERWTVHVPFSIYLGWITVATIANASALLYRLGWSTGGLGISAAAWTVIVLVAAVAIAAAMSLTRGDLAYLVVLVWAFIGIAVKQTGSPTVVIASGAAAAAVVVLGAVGLVLRLRPAAQRPRVS
jgi:hypothetical protein